MRGTAVIEIHPTALVHPRAELDEGVKIGPYSIIGAGVKIGAGTEILDHVHIEGNTILGPANKIYSFAVIGSPPQDKKYKGEEVYLEIGARNVFREFVTVNPGTEGGGYRTVIGNGNHFLAYVHVAHDVKIGNDCVFSNMTQIAGHVEIADRVTIGGMSGIHQFVRIGEGAMVGGGSMVTMDVPPYALVVGNRASLKGLNIVGLERMGKPPSTIYALKEAYRILFRQGLPLDEALLKVQEEFPDVPEVLTLIEFLRRSERGVVRP